MSFEVRFLVVIFFSSVADCLFGLGAGDAQQLLHTAAARAQILGPVTSAFAHSKALLDMV